MTLRKRMMILFCSLMGLFLIASYLVLYLVVQRVVGGELDHRLLETARTLSDDLANYIASADDITEVDSPGQIFEIFDEQGKPIAVSRSLHGQLLGIDAGHRSGQVFQAETFDVPEQGRLRVMSVPVRSIPITSLDHWGVAVVSGSGTLVACSSNETSEANSSSQVALSGVASDTSRCLTAAADGPWHSVALPARQTGKFTLTFDATPSLVAEARLGLSQGEQTTSPAFPVTIYFNSSALIQAMNGGSKQGAVSYRAGVSYHFRVVVDVPARTYSVFVKPALGSPARGGFSRAGVEARGPEEQLAVNFSFRKGRNWTLVVARSTREAEASLTKLKRIIGALLVSNLLLLGFVSSWYVRRSLRPLSNLTEKVTSLAHYLKTRHPSEAGVKGHRLAILKIDTDDEPGRLAEAFNQLAAILDDTLQQMRQFLSDASHELRTPLSILRGEAELLLHKPRSPEEYSQAIGVIHNELKHLGDIVDGLFTLSMADAGQLRMAKESLYLNDLLEEACLRVAHQAKAKSIDIKHGQDHEVLSTGDEVLLRELFLILLDNAVKYSLPGTTIRVALKVEGDTAIMTFQDQGIGIAPEHIPHIFERFYRVPAADREDVQGGGLGLAIAKAIAQAHGGGIECASAPGQGSVFTVRLPRSAETEAAQAS